MTMPASSRRRDRCIDDATLVALVEARLPDAQRHDVDAHVVECSVCRRLLSAMAQVAEASAAMPTSDAGDEPSRDSTPSFGARAGAAAPAIGTRVGRYVVVAPLAAGGMGEIVLADDTVLGRRVALKFLHREPSRCGDAATSRPDAAMLAEARALAQLADPHVVTAFDVGCVDGRMYLAMPWIRGQSLAQWLATPRSATAVASVFAQLARALAAVHARGLVHRDVKPSNAMLGDDGRVQLVDLGLAAPHADASGPQSRRESPTLAAPVAGTPAYLAPECHLGEPGDARSDQFSFCVALFEALWGQRPFVGRDLASLTARVLEGAVTRPRGRRVPRRLDRIAARGLARDRELRWPSMLAIAEALEATTRRPSFRATTLTLTATTSLLVAVRLGAAAPHGAPRETAATTAPATATAPSIPGTAIATARATAAALRASGHLDEAAALARAWLPIAAAHGPRGEGELALELGRAEVAARRHGELALERAHLLAVRADDDAGATRAALELALVAAFDHADREDAARWFAFAESRGQRRPHDASLHRELREAHARARLADGELEQAIAELSACVDARRREDTVDTGVLALLLDALGQAEREAGHLDAARRHHAEAASRIAALRGELHPDHASALEQLAHVDTADGHIDAAMQGHRRALAIREHTLGARHPHVVPSLVNLGELMAQRDPAAAELLLQRALEIQRGTAADPSDVALTLHGLANVHRVLGRPEAARLDVLAALEILEPRLGTSHPTLIALWGQLALIELELGRAEDALTHGRTALDARVAAVGVDHPTLAPSLFTVGLALVELGDAEAATPALERAMALSLGRDDGAEHEIGFVLAQALWTQPTQRSRARTLARAALEGMRRDGAFDPATVASVAAWLGSHRA